MEQATGSSGVMTQAKSSSSKVLILHRGSRRVAIAFPATLDLALSAAAEHFPSLNRPLHLTRNVPDLGGDIEVTQSVWTTDWIQGRAFLTLDVHESKVGIKAEVEKNGGGGGGGVKRENVENSNEAEPKRIKLEKDKEDKGKASARMSAHHGAGGGGGNRRHTPVQQEERVDFDMKRELAVKLATFEGEQLQEALDIIRRSQPDLLGAPDQGIDLDIDQLNQGTLVPLYRYVCPRSPQDPGTDEST